MVIGFLYGSDEINLIPKTDFKIELASLLYDCLFEATPGDDQALFRSVVNGGAIMVHAERPVGLVAAAQNCATHSPLSVATGGGGCTAWSSMQRYGLRLSRRV